jgi:hypothetical protein
MGSGLRRNDEGATCVPSFLPCHPGEGRDPLLRVDVTIDSGLRRNDEQGNVALFISRDGDLSS